MGLLPTRSITGCVIPPPNKRAPAPLLAHATTADPLPPLCILSLAAVCRLWIAPPNERPLPDVYEDIYGGPLTIGSRGGIHVADTQEHIVLEAE